MISNAMHSDDDIGRQGFDQGSFEKGNHAPRTMQSTRCRVDWRVTLFTCFLAMHTARADESEWRIWLEPSFMKTNVTAPIVGAKQTVMAAGRFENGEWVG